MAPGVDTGDTAWMLAATALVLLMTPALGLFYAGLVRSWPRSLTEAQACNAVSTHAVAARHLEQKRHPQSLIGTFVPFKEDGGWAKSYPGDGAPSRLWPMGCKVLIVCDNVE